MLPTPLSDPHLFTDNSVLCPVQGRPDPGQEQVVSERGLGVRGGSQKTRDQKD